MRALPPIPGPGKPTPVQGELGWQAVLFRVILKGIKLWHCSFAVTLGTGRGSVAYGMDLVGRRQLLFLCLDLNGGGRPDPREGSPGSPWPRQAVAQAGRLLLEGWQG